MTVTENLGLKKPGGSDKVLISDLNTNADKLDEIIGKLSELNTTQKSSLVAAINAALLDTSESADAAASSATAATTAKNDAVAAKTAAETAKNDAVAAKTAAETAKTDAVAAKTAAESAAASATESKTAAASSATTATEKATAATNSATAAASSATAAQQSADSAAAAVTGAVKYNAAQTLTVAQKEQAQKNIGVTWPCNPNLLDNWYFGNPVNQRGQTEYASSDGVAYTIDRWQQNSAGVQVNEGYITVGGNGLLQKPKHLDALIGKKVTLSALTAENTLYSGSSVLSADGVSFFDVATGDLGGLFNSFFSAFQFYPIAPATTANILAAKLELGTEQTLAHQDSEGNWVLNGIPDYHTELLKCIQSTADPNDTYANKVVTTMDRVVNPNLLDNWYFINPVNQREATSYAGKKYTIDRWYHRDGDDFGTVSLTSNGITLSRTDTSNNGHRGFNMRIDKPEQLLGKTVTISALIAENTHAAGNARISLDGANSVAANSGPLVRAMIPVTSSTTLITGTALLPPSITYGSTTYDGLNFGIYVGTDYGTLTILAVKLELGSEQTLAHQDANGNWVLNEIPDYGEQLARCQRYYQIYSSASARPTLAVDCRPVMRADPARSTITIGSTTYYANSADL